jgi:hypothetical protein
MAEVRGFRSRREAAEYWDAHGVDEHETEEVKVEVKKPLSVVLSVRLDEEHFKTLQLLAKAQRVGTATMARILLTQGLEKPGSQLVWQALPDPHGNAEMVKMFEEGKVPPGEGEAVYFVLSKQQLDYMGRLILQTAHDLLGHTLKGASLEITPEKSRDLFEQLRQLDEVRT